MEFINGEKADVQCQPGKVCQEGKAAFSIDEGEEDPPRFIYS